MVTVNYVKRLMEKAHWSIRWLGFLSQEGDLIDMRARWMKTSYIKHKVMISMV